MIKQPGPVRALVLADVDKMLRHLHSMLTLFDPTEHDALLALESPQLLDLIAELTGLLLTRFGHAAPQVKEPRFDKNYRAAAKLIPKPPRGEPRPKRRPAVNGDSQIGIQE